MTQLLVHKPPVTGVHVTSISVAVCRNCCLLSPSPPGTVWSSELNESFISVGCCRLSSQLIIVITLYMISYRIQKLMAFGNISKFLNQTEFCFKLYVHNVHKIYMNLIKITLMFIFKHMFNSFWSMKEK